MASAGTSFDPLTALRAALNLPTDSDDQRNVLNGLRDALEANPQPIPMLCTHLIPSFMGQPDSAIKQWIFELLWFGVVRAALPYEIRAKLAYDCLDPIIGILYDPQIYYLKLGIQTFSTAYPLLFRYCCTEQNTQNGKSVWDKLVKGKSRILEVTMAPTAPSGVRLAGLKFMQRVILVDNRLNDPRLSKTDPNLAIIPNNHPFLPVNALEAEGRQLIEQFVRLFFSTANPDTLTALITAFGGLAKMRPNLMNLIVTTLTSWNPALTVSLPASTQKSINKAIRIVLAHLVRTNHGAPYRQQVDKALMAIDERIRQITQAEEARRLERKRPYPASSDEQIITGDSKRVKLEHSLETSKSFQAVSPEMLATFDFTSLPTSSVTDIVVNSLKRVPAELLRNVVETYKRTRTEPTQPQPQQEHEDDDAFNKESAPTLLVVKQEPIDPLNMDIEDELQLETADVETEMDNLPASQEDLRLTAFKLPQTRSLSEEQRKKLLDGCLNRVRDRGEENLAIRGVSAPTFSEVPLSFSSDLWILLLIRLITRGASSTTGSNTVETGEKSDSTLVTDTNGSVQRLRKMLCDYILEDFSARSRLALLWLSEEWYNDRILNGKGLLNNKVYDSWLQYLVTERIKTLDGKDKVFPRFLMDLPVLPDDIIDVLRGLATDPDKMQVGFSVLRDLVSFRPPLREKALTALLELTTHIARVTSKAAIITVKRWSPDVEPMASRTRAYALQLLDRIRTAGKTSDETTSISPYLSDKFSIPAKIIEVQQHVELLFALSPRNMELLEPLFTMFPEVDRSVQDAIQQLIGPLIKSFSSNNSNLLSMLRSYPDGTESLVLSILQYIIGDGRPNASIVNLIKHLISERGADARFLMLIIAEMDKADIIKHLPKLVAMLNGTAERKAMVKAAFSSIITTPPQTSASSNQPRIRQSELLTPAELMVLLHDEKEVTVKQSIEAISLCFAMPDVYKSEVLAVVMQQIVDEPVLPVLFLRTVMQSLNMYKSLTGFVCSTLLSRLITKKIWTNPQLWQGFQKCAKQTEPHSFDALLQLPKEHLKDLVDKQPDLKVKLREYVIKKTVGNKGNKTRLAGFLEVLGDGDEGTMATD